MTNEELIKIANEIKADDGKEYTITPRDLINGLGCERRTGNNKKCIDKFLSENQLAVEPSYRNVWIDSDIKLCHEKKLDTAKTGFLRDAVKKLCTLDAANKTPVFINNDADLIQAVTIMLFHDYSQLPVVTNTNVPKAMGFISWKTIGRSLKEGGPITGGRVKDYLSKNVIALPQDTPILDAVHSIAKNGFVIVTNKSGIMVGIVTATDIALQFIANTEPFMLLEEIECHVRQMLADKFKVKELEEFCLNANDSRKVDSIDDLNFGEYIRLMECDQNWTRLKISIDKKYFLRNLDSIREIRNEIMHFDPDGVGESQIEKLRTMAKFLSEITVGKA